ncbi:hypothetical protein SHO565_59760 [Streptomyces sp. HO565]
MLFRAQLYGLAQADSAIPWMAKNCTTPAIHAEYPIRTLTCPPSGTRIPCGQTIMRRWSQALRQAPWRRVGQTLLRPGTGRSPNETHDPANRVTSQVAPHMVQTMRSPTPALNCEKRVMPSAASGAW